MSSKDYKSTWQIADVDKDDLLSDEEKKILKAAIVSRHQFTYHYKYSTPLLAEGLQEVYKKQHREEAKNAYILDPDPNNPDFLVKRYRSFYIDLAFQQYMQDELNLDGEVRSEILQPFIDWIGHFSLTISMILKRYHDRRKWGWN